MPNSEKNIGTTECDVSPHSESGVSVAVNIDDGSQPPISILKEPYLPPLVAELETHETVSDHRSMADALKRIEALMHSLLSERSSNVPQSCVPCADGGEAEREAAIKKVVLEFPALKSDVEILQRQLPEIRARIPECSTRIELEKKYQWLSTKELRRRRRWPIRRLPYVLAICAPNFLRAQW